MTEDEPRPDVEQQRTDHPPPPDDEPDEVGRRLHDLAVANDCGPDVDDAPTSDDRPRT